MTWEGRRVLVTGGAGFIGSHLVERLVGLGAVVSVLDKLSTGQASNLDAVADALDFRHVDLRTDDVGAVLREIRPEVLFHLAANAYVPPSVENPRWDFETNLLGTLNVLEACRTLGPPPKVVFTSTAAVYAEGLEQPLQEDYPTRPPSPYGVSKLGAEGYVGVYAKLFSVPGVKVRLFPVFGKRLRKQVIYDLLCKIRVNPRELFIHGDGTQVRDFNHVANVVEALLTVADRAPGDGGVYNIGSGVGTPIAQLVRLLCDLMGVTPRLVYGGAVRPGDAQRWIADTGRLLSLGYAPRMPLNEGLAEFVAWFLRDGAPIAASGR